jgi:hypothetical protein
MIKSEEISVVIQGGVNPKLTRECINSVRKIHPKSEVILSTWQGSNLDSIDLAKVDLVHLSDDPGGRVYSVDGHFNNVARQITSTLEGLKKAKRKYAFKVRSDIILKGKIHLAYFDRFKEYNERFKIFDKRILICSNYTLNPENCPILFHPSDWVSFGQTDDMLKLWDIPVPLEDHHYNYFNNIIKPTGVPHPRVLARYLPEQYIILECVKKYISNIDLPNHYYDVSDSLIDTSNQVLLNNFVVLDYRRMFEIEFKKYNPGIHFAIWQLDFLAWVKLYNKYFLVDEKIQLSAYISNLITRKKYSYLANKLRNRANNLKWFFIKRIRDVEYAIKKFIK